MKQSLKVMVGLFFLTFAVSLSGQPKEGLYSLRASFHATNRVVSASFFTWYSSHVGQASGPWRPLVGRVNWTGEPPFWKEQVKQVMMANIDMLYVHLIPSSTEQRINFFKALNELRAEGYNVPKVAPFLDPIISWGEKPSIDLGTASGKDTFVNQYIEFFKQYYSVNADQFADDFLARFDHRVVLDTWHLHLSLSNLSSLSREDVASRLVKAFGEKHPVFTNGIYMVTTALNGPTLKFADERVPLFEINQYFRTNLHRGILSVQLKPGYWDQNIRNPGDFLKREGGRHYAKAWKGIDRNLIHRVYIESWNEYDEGTGIYAAAVGAPYLQPGSGNTNSDSWSSEGDPYEYIHATARGAAAFNDVPDRDAKILWHTFPTNMMTGETRTVTVIVRNEGDESWTALGSHKFGQKEGTVLFGKDQYLLDDKKDEIPIYGGIFRGRPKAFQVIMEAPDVTGIYRTHWSMKKGEANWFGEELSIAITVQAPVEISK